MFDEKYGQGQSSRPVLNTKENSMELYHVETISWKLNLLITNKIISMKSPQSHLKMCSYLIKTTELSNSLDTKLMIYTLFFPGEQFYKNTGLKSHGKSRAN